MDRLHGQHQQQEPTPQGPAPRGASTADENILNPHPTPSFNLNGFANLAAFNLTQVDTACIAGIDWEHVDRSPTGSSIIDRSSVAHESGRTFHGYKDGKYFLPNDAAEQDRLDLQHAGFLRLLDGRLYLAPLQDPKFVLDIATGTGIWALEFGVFIASYSPFSVVPANKYLIAERHPEAQVIGTDLSDIQPKWRMPNCSFIQDDAEDEWLFGSTEDPIQFDYVHLRMVITCFDNPRTVMRNAFKSMKPGGWIEYLDISIDLQSIGNTLEGISSNFA